MRFFWAVVLLLISSPLYAFSQMGHQLVCEIAYQQVSDTTRQQLNLMMSKSPYSHFTKSCSWADEVRNQPQFSFASALHYVNFPRSHKQVTQADCPQQGCILSAISHMQLKLKQNRDDWQALLFLAHFIGDLHQPLHVSYADDLGGNRTAVYFYGLPNNLHGVWDFALLKQLGYETDNAKADALKSALTRSEIQQWQQGDVLSWANESAALTQQIYQQYKPGMLLDAAYVSQYSRTVEQKLKQAGVRLAMVLDQLFSAN